MTVAEELQALRDNGYPRLAAAIAEWLYNNPERP
jgi:hypothetical protein